MCIYHQRIQIISRGQGKSGVAALAYRTGSQLSDSRTGITWDYSKKSVESVEFVLPDSVPDKFKDWARALSTDKERVLQEFSDHIEAHEKRSDSQIYREFEFALQRELTDEQNKEIARKHIQKSCADHGMVALLSFHKEIEEKTGEENFHCHALMLTRSIDEHGLGLKNREWNSKEFHTMYRENLATITNEKFTELGIDMRVDHRSLEEQGLLLRPLTKLGRSAIALVARGSESLRYKIFQDNKRHNLFLLQQRPDYALEVISNNQSTFTELDVKQLVGRYADTQEAFSNLYARIMSSPELIQLENSSLDPSERKGVFTTRAQLKSELSISKKSETLTSRASHKVDNSFIDSALAHLNEKLMAYRGLSQDQVNAIKHITGPEQLTALVGYAGAGKSTALVAAKMAWEMQGYKVVGLAPTGTATDNLRKDGFKAHTVASFLWQSDHGRMQLKKDTVLVLDEAGMVDSGSTHKLIEIVDKLGIKLVLVGDSAQLQPIQAGPAFRLIQDKSQISKIESIVRQEEDWQKGATVHFGQENSKAALELYQTHNCIQLIKQDCPDFSTSMDDASLVKLGSTAKQMAGVLWYHMEQELQLDGVKREDAFKHASRHPDYKTYKEWQQIRDVCLSEMEKRGLVLDKAAVDLRKNAKLEMVRDWLKDREQYPNASTIMLANSRKEVEDINTIAREALKEQGVISREESLLEVEVKRDKGLNRKDTITEKRGFAIGDQIIFKTNDNGLKVSNGNLGIIQLIKGDKVTVKLHGAEGRIMSFSNRLYKNIEHGWATTIMSSQGRTYDRVKCLASFEMYRNLAYVAATRHRQDFKIFGSSIEFKDIQNLISRLSRTHEKLLTNDYVVAQEKAERHVEGLDTRWLTIEQAERVVEKERNVLERAEKALTRVKDYSHAVSHFVKGIFSNTTEKVSIDVYGNRSEAERAIEKLGLSTQGSRDRHGGSEANSYEFDHTIIAEQKRRGQQQTQHMALSASMDGASKDIGVKASRTVGAAQPHVGDGSISEHQLSLRKKAEKGAHQLPAYDSASESSRTSNLHRPKHLFDMDKLRSLLEADGERLVTHLLGQSPNPAMSTQKQKRYGNKGSFSYNCQGSKAGKWNDFEAGDGGDLFKLVGRELGLKSFREQLNYVAGFYGLSPEQEMPLTKISNPRKADSEYANNERKVEQIGKAYAMSKPIEGTLAERYLREHRKIVGELPPSLRFLNSYGKDNLPALVSFATDEKGVRTGMQVTYLDVATAKKADLDVNKRSHGIIKGSAVVIREGSGHVYVAEGVETALSVASVVPRNSKVVATLGIANFNNLKVCKDQNVIICADNDVNKPNAVKTIEKAVTNLEAQRANVIVIKPEREGQDFNDVLKEKGTDGVASYIEKAEKLSSERYTRPLTERFDRDIRQLKATLTEDLKNLYNVQFKKEISPDILTSKTEQIKNAAEYLMRSDSDVLSHDSYRRREAALIRAAHELKAAPERARDYYKGLTEKLRGKEEGTSLAARHGERLAIIEGRLIEQDVLSGGTGQRRWEISNPARIELEENNKQLDKFKTDYMDAGMSKAQAEVMASLHIRYKEMFGKDPEWVQIDKIKTIRDYITYRHTQQQTQKDSFQAKDSRDADIFILQREETMLLRAGGLSAFSEDQYPHIREAAEKSYSSHCSDYNLDRPKNKEYER